MSFDEATKIADARSLALRHLAKIAGADPDTFFVAADFQGLDLSGQDLSGFNLSHANFSGIKISATTIVDREFFPQIASAALDSLRDSIDSGDPRTRGRALIKAAAIKQRLGNFAEANALLEELVFSDAVVPMRPDELSISEVNAKLQHAVSRKYLRHYAEQRALDRTLRAMFQKGPWSDWVIDTVNLMLDEAESANVFRRSLDGLITAIAAEMNERNREGLVERWSRYFGLGTHAGIVIARGLPESQSKWIIDWATRWHDEHGEREEAHVIALMLGLISYFPDAYVPGKFTPDSLSSREGAEHLLRTTESMLRRKLPNPVRGGLVGVVELFESYLSFATDRTAGPLGALTERGREQLIYHSRFIAQTFSPPKKRSR